MTGLTQGSFVADSIAQKIPGAHSGQLGKASHEPLGLSSFANARRTDENDASSAFELLGGHSKTLSRYAQQWSISAVRGGSGLLLVGRGGSSELLGYRFELHFEVAKGMHICTKSGLEAQ